MPLCGFFSGGAGSLVGGPGFLAGGPGPRRTASLGGWEIFDCRGLGGSKPKPPYSASYCPASALSTASTCAGSSLGGLSCGRCRRLSATYSASASPVFCHFSVSLAQASCTRASTVRNPIRPSLSRGGKYVPPISGLASGVKNIDRGQPPPWLDPTSRM